MPELILSPFPIVTITRRHDGMWLLLLDGDGVAGPYAWRESIDIALENLPDGPRNLWL